MGTTGGQYPDTRHALRVARGRHWGEHVADTHLSNRGRGLRPVRNIRHSVPCEAGIRWHRVVVDIGTANQDRGTCSP